MSDGLGGLCFVGFALAALILAVLEPPVALGAGRRRLVRVFLLYSLGVSFAAGLAQHDAWPFTYRPIAAGRVPPSLTRTRLVAVDIRSTEHRIDARAWEPLGFDELNAWLQLRFPRLDPPAQDRAARYLLQKAEAARSRARDGRGVGDRGILGPLSAPGFNLHPRIWSSAGDVPSDPFVGLRLYVETWPLEDRRRDGTRALVYEYPRR